MTKALSRQFGQPRKPAQDRRARAGLGILRAAADAPLGVFAATTLGLGSAVDPRAVRVLGAPRPCLDCGRPVVAPLRSQPRRCTACGRLKRREHYNAYQSTITTELAALAAQQEALEV